ncbi:phage tail protein [Brevibacillus parabrevis]|uniref:Phage tail fibre protein N-terminal domain-containing protein n=1 Tax=Brevibacillus parabrevis TaxID=54914 RepID=A0A4Y3PV32_BREPA|nr:phage tail protein [Brevibacillus parabrevis]RNB94445.1 hypothetical protein EDM60_18840 [Brevibacillus parabrevis]GEB35318.1 hypothetical protein BPA01_48980 [Brevibacillus parabrevis]
MGQFNGSVLTEDGLSLLSRAQIGAASIQFTRVGIGDGFPSGDLRLQTKLVHETMSLPLLELKLTGRGQTQIKAAINNTELNQGVFIREIGLFANDPAKGEILYAVANAGPLADYLPAAGTDVVEEIVNFNTVIGSTENVTAIVSQQAFVAVDTFAAHVNDMNVHVPLSVISALITRVQTLEDALLNDFKNNIFKVSFSNPIGVRIKRGWFDQTNSQLVIK